MRAGGAPGHFQKARRAGGGAADGVDHGEVLRQKVIAPDDLGGGVEPVGECQKGRFQFGGAHVECGGVDEVARQKLALGHGQKAGGINAFGGFQKGGFAGRFGGAIAVEAVGLQKEGEGRLLTFGLREIALEMPGPCGQGCGGAGQMEAAPRPRFGAAHPGHSGLHRAIGIGDQAQIARPRLKPRGAQPCGGGGGLGGQKACKPLGRDKMQGAGGGIGCGEGRVWHDVLRAEAVAPTLANPAPPATADPKGRGG